MVRKSHQLAGIAAVSYQLLQQPRTLSLETLVAIGVVTFVGSLVADVDNMGAPMWRHRFMVWDGELTRDFLQGHRSIAHSLLGVALFSFALLLLLELITIKNLDKQLLIYVFMWAQLSHLVADSLTIQGVPWLFPLKIKLGFPPIAFLRIKTGGLLERYVVFPLLGILIVWIYYTYRGNIPTIVLY